MFVPCEFLRRSKKLILGDKHISKIEMHDKGIGKDYAVVNQGCFVFYVGSFAHLSLSPIFLTNALVNLLK